MTLTAYQTDDMEGATRELVAQSYRCIVFEYCKCPRPIRIRANRIADLNPTVVRSWDSFAQDTIDRWMDEGGGPLIYRHNFWSKLMVPKADAMVIVECPLQYDTFESYVAPIQRDIAIYRPPMWDLHEEAVDFFFPFSNIHQTIFTTIDCLVGRPLSEQMQAALERSGFPPETTSVFHASEIEAMTGIREDTLRRVLKSYRLRKFYHRFHPYTPHVEPDDPDMLDIYRVLERQEPDYRGQRFCRFKEPRVGYKSVPGWHYCMKRMIKKAYVSEDVSIYVMRQGYPKMNYLITDAIATARRGSWYKMRNYVDDSPEFPIYEITPSPSDIRSAPLEPT